MGVEVGMGVWGDVPCTHTCTRTHACTHMHVKHANHVKHGCLHVGGHLQFLYMYTCAYVHACACVCGGTPPHAHRCPWHPPTPLPPPESRREPKVHLFRSCEPLIKKFPVFALDPIRPYLDWARRGFLTSWPIYNPFKFDFKWRPKCKIELKCQFAIEPSTTKKFEMYP